MSAAWESLHRATHELASSDSIKQRLINAFSNHLKELDPASLPPEQRERFESLAARLTCVRPLRGENAVTATVRKMSNSEASECAHQLIDLVAEVAARGAETGRLRPRRVVSLYSAEA
jgi:DNA repair ATPase RecN